MDRECIVFLVRRPGEAIENVIVAARNREHAKRLTQPILKGDSDKYVVSPLTERGSETIFLMGGNQ